MTEKITITFISDDNIPFKNKEDCLNLERDMSGLDDHLVKRERSFEVFNDISLGGDMNSNIDFNDYKLFKKKRRF